MKMKDCRCVKSMCKSRKFWQDQNSIENSQRIYCVVLKSQQKKNTLKFSYRQAQNDQLIFKKKKQQRNEWREKNERSLLNKYK